MGLSLACPRRAVRSVASRNGRGLGRLWPITWHRNVKHQVKPESYLVAMARSRSK